MRRVGCVDVLALLALLALLLAITGGAYALSVSRADNAVAGAANHPPRLTAPGW
jgi:hypothetical protein